MTALERQHDAPTLTLNKHRAALETVQAHLQAALREVCDLATLSWTEAEEGRPLRFDWQELEIARAALRSISGQVRSEQQEGL